MHQFESAFALAHGRNWETPQTGWAVRGPLNIGSQPLVDHSQIICRLDVQNCTKMAHALASLVVKEAVVRPRREASEIELNTKVERTTWR